MVESDELNRLIDMRVDKKLESTKRKYDFFDNHFWVGEVDIVNSGSNTATVLLPNQTESTSSKQNKTNQTLTSGDSVLLFSPYGTLGSSFILVAFKQYA